ncbi:nicotinate-nucleotide adenylyltransferase [Lachnospiraceae bacterium PF1-21]|uniref:nicotinate-nucleotide adenylyltransferase n=1 Tax=Ohessyouella blattaphilus TaxID=2949333 RepID=UPI003E24CA90
MRVGIMGGTFDPIHNGHLHIAKAALAQFSLDEIWFLPNGNPPHKDASVIKSKVADRVAMIALAIADQPYFLLNEYESNRLDVSYTYQTLEHFKKQYPYHEFYFILGADSLQNLEKWKCPERVFAAANFLAAYRDEMDTRSEMEACIRYLEDKYQAHISLLIAPPVDISSSDIREALKEGREITGLVPDKVYDYIKSQALYRSL